MGKIFPFEYCKLLKSKVSKREIFFTLSNNPVTYEPPGFVGEIKKTREKGKFHLR